jgi:acyl-CoA synthetase (AMP-forming)/AMP-acid ligase II
MPDRASTELAVGANANIARHLARMAAAQPGVPALKIPRGRAAQGDIDYLTLSFAELHAEAEAWVQRLERAGVRRGDRVLVMVRQGLPLIAAVFGLFRMGAVPVVIDPGMGLRSFLACVERSRPRALLGIPLAQLMSRVFRKAFASVEVRIPARSTLTARLSTGVLPPGTTHREVESLASDLAAVLFTSGSTGASKGVCYEHGMFDAQVRLIRATYGIEPGEVDLPMLPIFALFNPALGMTTIVPELDPRKPAAFDPARIVQAIRQEKVTNSFGSPALWSRIADHCRTHQKQLPSLRRVLCAGAAVPTALWQAARDFLPNGKLHSPYGATEALPVASIASDEVPLESVAGACVGRSVPELEVRIIAISDEPIAQISEARELGAREIGEIIVRGPVVTREYDAMPAATIAAKVVDPSADPSGERDSRWHRMGDCGYRDAEGRLWFCGRKAERVETKSGTLHTEPCEQVIRQHHRVHRCALIGLGPRGDQRPAIVVETDERDIAKLEAFARELRAVACRHASTAAIDTFYFRPRFPVDVRHNAKIHRLTLARWAQNARTFRIKIPT